jgi:hypothetical protein
MALTKTILKNTDKEVIVKVQGNSGSAVFTLGELALVGEVSDANTSVSISGIQWSGATDGVITIKRNNIIIATLQTNNAGALDMMGQGMIPDNTEANSGFEISVNNIQCELWLRLLKANYKITY